MNTSSLAIRPFRACTLAVLTLVVSLNAQGQTVGKEYLVRAADASQVQTRASACAPATALRDLEWNNVRALVENGGTLWHERANWRGAYIVPKEDNVSTVFAGALWIGGISPDQQLKLAAVRYRRDGNDFWPGPLSNDGAAEVDATTCNEYDEFFVSTRADARRHRQYFEALEAGTVEEEFPEGYAMPAYFRDYPAHGNTDLNQDYYLAPFLDYNGDGFYSPEQGDYPWYDFLQEIDCGNRRREDIVPLYGDQNYYWIFNDKGNVHSESQGEPIGMEIRAQAFAFATNDEVNNMTFNNYVLINQGTQTLTNTYMCQWVDSDLGGISDDYVGCDVQRGLGYTYNGDAFDESDSFSPGYGENPPAFGVDFFEGPYQDADGIDNPLTTNFFQRHRLAGHSLRGHWHRLRRRGGGQRALRHAPVHLLQLGLRPQHPAFHGGPLLQLHARLLEERPAHGLRRGRPERRHRRQPGDLLGLHVPRRHRPLRMGNGWHPSGALV